MKIIISALNTNGQEMFYEGYGDTLTEKGLGSGALTGTNRIPTFTSNIEGAKVFRTYIDGRRTMSEIIDAVRYKDIEGLQTVSIHFLNE